MCLEAGQLSDGVWVQSCDLPTAQACCYGESNCCANSTNQFTYKPGILVAVLGNPDGLNRLVTNYLTTSVASTSPSSSTATESAAPSDTDTGSTASNSQPSTSSSQPNTPAIVTGIILGTAVALAFVGMLFFWRKWRSEKQRNEELIPTTVTRLGAPEAVAMNNSHDPAELRSNGVASHELQGSIADKRNWTRPGLELSA